MLNFRDQTDEPPLALQLQIAYSGDNLPAFWRPIEDVLGTLLSAGFKRREAATLIRNMPVVRPFGFFLGQRQTILARSLNLSNGYMAASRI